MKSIFDKKDSDELIARIKMLDITTQPLWGKMNVAQMLAHCNVSFELCFEDKYGRPSALKRWLLKTFVKKGVVNEVPYKKNSPTAPIFKVEPDQDFDYEKERIISYITKTFELGAKHFQWKDYPSFGRLTSKEWSNMFYKHMDHHLQQFGV